MIDQVKEYRRSIVTTVSDKVWSDDTPVAMFYESSTSLLRIGGFALLEKEERSLYIQITFKE